MWNKAGVLVGFGDDNKFEAKQVLKYYNPILEKYGFSTLDEELIYKYEVLSGFTIRKSMLNDGSEKLANKKDTLVNR